MPTSSAARELTFCHERQKVTKNARRGIPPAPHAPRLAKISYLITRINKGKISTLRVEILPWGCDSATCYKVQTLNIAISFIFLDKLKNKHKTLRKTAKLPRSVLNIKFFVELSFKKATEVQGE